MAPARPERYHALDALRAVAMFLGIVLHAAIPYLAMRVLFWPVHDEHQSTAFDLLLFAIHGFRMQVFFLLAGFFGALLYARHGAGRTAIHRLKRIALPLALAMVTIQPALQAASVYAAAAACAADPDDPTHNRGFAETLTPGDTPAQAVVHHFTSGTFVRYLIPAHLWFLWYLLLCFAVVLPLGRLADRLRDRRFGRRFDAVAGALFGSRLRWIVLAVGTFPVLLLMDMPGVADTPLSWWPNWHLLGYYFLFFLVGWTLYRHRDRLSRFAGGWRWSLSFANLLVLPVALALVGISQDPAAAGLSSGEALRYLIPVPLALYTWLMVGGLLGLFLCCVSAERAWVRWAADSAYWCYLASLPPVILLQYLVVDWELPAAVKFLAVTAATMAVVLATYRWGVRYTWVGRLLNGPRTRSAVNPTSAVRTKWERFSPRT